MFADNFLSGKIALVTGGRTGIGLELVRQFLRYGASVIAVGRRQEALEERFSPQPEWGEKLFARACDITDPIAVKELMEWTFEKFKKLDILVNNASLNFKIQAEKIRPKMLDMSIKTNLVGHIYVSVEAVRRMKNLPGYKKIINITAYAGGRGYPGVSHIHAAKMGLEALTRTWALEWARFGVLVNAVSPGVVLTENFIHAYSRLERIFGIDYRPLLEEYRTREQPLQKFTEPEDVANAVLFFASSLADNITGQVLSVDGGAAINHPYLMDQLLTAEKLEREKRKKR